VRTSGLDFAPFKSKHNKMQIKWGHPLAGPSSRHRLSRREESSLLPLLLSNSSTFDHLNYAPLFSFGRYRTLGLHQSPIRIKALGEISMENFIPPLANFVAPENCRYHAVSKVIRGSAMGSYKLKPRPPAFSSSYLRISKRMMSAPDVWRSTVVHKSFCR
jgi:hypothetical protein